MRCLWRLTICLPDRSTKTMYCATSRDVYNMLRYHGFSHDDAANAEGWCDFSLYGEWYCEDDFEIECLEN